MENGRIKRGQEIALTVHIKENPKRIYRHMKGKRATAERKEGPIETKVVISVWISGDD